MLTAGQILKTKQHKDIHAVSTEMTVLEAARLMAEKRIGALLVMKDNKTIGIVTERDYLQRFAPMNRLPSETLVREIMSSPLIHVSPNEDAKSCLALMAERQFRRLPVVESGNVVGLISMSDMLREIPAQQQFVITQLERYIRGDMG
ncbi:MAG: CBS domain-containing protein [Oxalobacter sp.]|jgi:CBS domain-containing protein|nr:MAG: CBS domain-containing protein [Oxalobacter sp.]